MFCGACRVDVGLTVDVRDGGAGEVRATATLDADAVEAVGGVRGQLALDDLRAAGWTVEGPAPTDDGGSEVVVHQQFDDPVEAERLLGEIAGPGVMRGFRIDQRRDFLKTRTSLRGEVDLGEGLASFSDPRLAEILGGSPIGVTDDQLEAHAGAPLERIFDLQVAARLPGRVTTNAPAEAGAAAAWPVDLGERVVLEATSEQWNRDTITLSVISAGATVLLLLLLAGRGARRMSRRRRAAPDV